MPTVKGGIGAARPISDSDVSDDVKKLSDDLESASDSQEQSEQSEQSETSEDTSSKE